MTPTFKQGAILALIVCFFNGFIVAHAGINALDSIAAFWTSGTSALGTWTLMVVIWMAYSSVMRRRALLKEIDRDKT